MLGGFPKTSLQLFVISLLSSVMSDVLFRLLLVTVGPTRGFCDCGVNMSSISGAACDANKSCDCQQKTITDINNYKTKMIKQTRIRWNNLYTQMYKIHNIYHQSDLNNPYHYLRKGSLYIKEGLKTFQDQTTYIVILSLNLRLRFWFRCNAEHVCNATLLKGVISLQNLFMQPVRMGYTRYWIWHTLYQR